MTNFGQSEQQRDITLNPFGKSINQENHEITRQPRDMWPTNTQTWGNNYSHESRMQQNHNPTISRQNNWQNNTQRTWGQSTSNGENQRNYNGNNYTN